MVDDDGRRSIESERGGAGLHLTPALREQPRCARFAWPTSHLPWQEPLADGHIVGAVRGSCVEMCALLGLPFVRFRAAVPEEWFIGSMAQAIGRHVGLSVQARLPTGRLPH